MNALLWNPPCACAAIKSGDPRQGMQIAMTAMKSDRQMVAIALVNNVRVLYSDDDGVERFASNCGLATKCVTHLPVLPGQRALFEDVERSDPAGDSGNGVP